MCTRTIYDQRFDLTTAGTWKLANYFALAIPATLTIFETFAGSWNIATLIALVRSASDSSFAFVAFFSARLQGGARFP